MTRTSRLVVVALVCALVPATLVRAEPGYPGSLTNQFPTASAPAVDAQPGQPAIFDASASSDADGTIVRAAWDFGDGANATGVHATHTYDHAGAWLALLTVTDDRGAFSSVPVMVHVGAQPDILTQDTTITTTTGDTLHAQIHRPDDGARHPVVMRYNIYCATFESSDEALVRSGYVFVHVEAPGVCGSSGHFDLWGPLVATDGHDAIDWAGTQPWSDGDVALTGHSGPAITALSAAMTRPDHLRTMVLGSPLVDLYRDVAYPGGTLTGGAAVYNAVLMAEPRQGMSADRVNGWTGWEQAMAENPTDDAFWTQRSLAQRFDDLRIPVSFVTSWNDIYWRGLFEWFMHRTDRASRLTVYPGPHWNMGDPTGADGFRSTQSQQDHAGSLERAWLDHFLLGRPLADRPALTYWMQDGGGGAAQAFSAGQWRTADTWPLPDTRWTRLDLGGGVLAQAPAGVANPSWLDFLAASQRQAIRRPMLDVDQRIDATALSLDGAPLTQSLQIAGPVTLTFTATLASPDATFHATLEDVWTDGSAHWLTTGTLRASMRAIDESRTLRDDAGDIVRVFHPHDAFDQPAAGQPNTYVVEIWPTANRFEPGHRVRLQLSLEQPWSTDAASGAALIQDASLLLPVAP